MSAVVEISDQNFEAEVLQAPGVVLVDFAASWCGPCKRLAPVIEELAGDLAGKAKVCHLDVDAAPETASRFGIMSVPTVMLFKAGQPAGQSLGFMPKDVLAQKIQALL